MNIKFLHVVNTTHTMLEDSGENINIDEVIEFLQEMNGKPFEGCIEFFDDHKEQTSFFIQNITSIIDKNEDTIDSKSLETLKSQYDTFVNTKNMIYEFKEIYDVLIPSIRAELLSESKELNKLIAFSSIDHSQKNSHNNEHNIDTLLEISKKGGNFLFFNRVGRNSTISEKRLSFLSTDSKSILKEKRNSMPLFLNDRDMMIFDDFLEIEKLNDALFKALREFLSEKIDIFNNKYNSDRKLFEDMITMIKNKYLELDAKFAQLSSNLKSFEFKLTVENWYSALSEMFENCMKYIENEFNKVDKVEDAELAEKVLIIDKHISLFNNLLDVSWNDQLYDKVRVFRNALEITWSKAKAKHSIVGKTEKKNFKTKEKLKAPFIMGSDLRSNRSSTIKEDISRAEKRKSVGTALFQKMNLRASFIQDFDGLDINESSEQHDLESTHIDEHWYNPKESGILYEQPSDGIHFSYHNMSSESFNDFEDLTLNDISSLGKNTNSLVVKSETALKLSTKATRIPIFDHSALQNKESHDIDFSKIQLKSFEETLDKKRAIYICDLVNTHYNDNIKVKNTFVKCEPINM